MSALERVAQAGSTGWRRNVQPPQRRAGKWDADGLRLVGIVAKVRGVPALLLLHPSRCTASVAEARQLAMYLMHVVLQRTYAEVGAFFGRDRTTVSYACAHIEDCRDRPRFDAEVAAIEAVLDAELETAA